MAPEAVPTTSNLRLSESTGQTSLGTSRYALGTFAPCPTYEIGKKFGEKLGEWDLEDKMPNHLTTCLAFGYPVGTAGFEPATP